MEWSNKKTLKFIELLEEEQTIWNTRHPKHKDRNAVRDAWMKISNCIDIHVTELKKKKESLLATYRKLARKVSLSKKTGSGYEDVVAPTWYAYEAMDRFLRTIYMPRQTINSEEIDETEKSYNSTESASPYASSSKKKTKRANTQSNLDLFGTENDILHIETETTKNDSSFQKPKRARKCKLPKSDHVASHRDEAFQILKLVAQEPSQNDDKQKDECQLYADLLCTRLRALDPYTRALAMHEIDNIMFRLRRSAFVQSSDSNVQHHPQVQTANYLHSQPAPLLQLKMSPVSYSPKLSPTLSSQPSPIHSDASQSSCSASQTSSTSAHSPQSSTFHSQASHVVSHSEESSTYILS